MSAEPEHWRWLRANCDTHPNLRDCLRDWDDLRAIRRVKEVYPDAEMWTLGAIEGVREKAAAAARAEILSLKSQVAFLEAQEVCARAHENVDECGYCQRDRLLAGAVAVTEADARVILGMSEVCDSDFDVKQFARPASFFAANRNLFASYEAFRKQLERRRLNGLAASGAVVDTRLGLMLHSERYQAWLMQPRKRGHRPG